MGAIVDNTLLSRPAFQQLFRGATFRLFAFFPANPFFLSRFSHNHLYLTVDG